MAKAFKLIHMSRTRKERKQKENESEIKQTKTKPKHREMTWDWITHGSTRLVHFDSVHVHIDPNCPSWNITELRIYT